MFFKHNKTNDSRSTRSTCIDICLLDPTQYDDDYLQIVNCCKRHVCRTGGYVKVNKKLINQCRFGFPFQTLEQSKIVFKETLTRVMAEMEIKRNDHQSYIAMKRY